MVSVLQKFVFSVSSCRHISILLTMLIICTQLDGGYIFYDLEKEIILHTELEPKKKYGSDLIFFQVLNYGFHCSK